MIYESIILHGGLKVIHLPTSSPVSYCGFIVKSGTRDEADDQQGMAHFVEHMLFKGTRKRKSWHILNRMESVGGELNAYTTKEETIIYSVCLQQDIERAIELMSDLIFHSTFPENGVEKEKDVILDEINSYEDSPSELIFDEFEDMAFAGHPLGRNILGTPQSIETFNSEKGLAFMNRHYVPTNMVFFTSSNLSFKTITRYANKYLAIAERNDLPITRIAPQIITPYTKVIKRDTFQSHILLGTEAYNLFDERRKILFFLNNILGGPGMNSRLNVSLREKNGLVYGIESNVTNYTDTGLFTIYFGCDPKNSEKCTSLVLKELKKLRDVKLTSMQMETARRQLMGQITISAENRESTTISMGKAFLLYGKCESEEEIENKINSITREQLQETANEIFDESKLFKLIYQ